MGIKKGREQTKLNDNDNDKSSVSDILNELNKGKKKDDVAPLDNKINLNLGVWGLGFGVWGLGLELLN